MVVTIQSNKQYTKYRFSGYRIGKKGMNNRSKRLKST